MNTRTIRGDSHSGGGVLQSVVTPKSVMGTTPSATVRLTVDRCRLRQCATEQQVKVKIHQEAPNGEAGTPLFESIQPMQSVPTLFGSRTSTFLKILVVSLFAKFWEKRCEK